MLPKLILASGSQTRADMLRRAGLAVEIEPPAVDEDELKAAFRDDDAPAEDCTLALAELKARRVSNRHPAALVIGADQMLECDGVWFDKPVDRDGARRHLVALAGKTHRLVTAVTVYRDGAHLWHAIDVARLDMRALSDTFIETYLDRAGPQVLSSVGAYQLEALGAQLFRKVDGDFFTVLGLPLLPLLGFLRGHGVLPA